MWGRRRSLQTKLLGTTLALLIILTGGALFTVRHFFGKQIRQEAIREIRMGAYVLSSIIERSGAQLLERGRVLAELPSLQAAITRERNQLESLLLEVKAVRAANLLWATDADGVILASTGEYPPLGSSLAHEPLATAALKGQPSLGFDLFGGEWWLVLSLPVRQASLPAGEQASPAVVGTVSLALLIGEAYLERLSELVGTQVGLIWGEHHIWPEGWPEVIRQQIVVELIHGLGPAPKEVFHRQEGRFLWIGRTVTGGEPPIATGPVAILGLRLDESVIRRSTQAIIWIALLTMGVGSLLSLWAIRSVTRPLKTLVSDALRIGQGELSHRSAIRGSDEVGDLAGSFNRMVAQVQGSYNKLAELNQTLEERVADRTRQLEQAQARLLRAEKLASIGQLAAGVAHELNNPLMVIMGNTQLANRMLTRSAEAPGEASSSRSRSGSSPDAALAEIKELLKDLDQESQRCKLIVNNLLDFARIKPPARVEMDVHSLLDECLRLVGYQTSLQTVQVVRRYRKDLPLVKADRDQIKQVFINVILNAVQAMPLGGTLTLETDSEGEQARIAIQDTGVGIPEEEIKKVFDPFYTTKEPGAGTGLGLSLSYTIVQRHQGTISIASQPGKGATVLICLPFNA